MYRAGKIMDEEKSKLNKPPRQPWRFRKRTLKVWVSMFILCIVILFASLTFNAWQYTNPLVMYVNSTNTIEKECQAVECPVCVCEAVEVVDTTDVGVGTDDKYTLSGSALIEAKQTALEILNSDDCWLDIEPPEQLTDSHTFKLIPHVSYKYNYQFKVQIEAITYKYNKEIMSEWYDVEIDLDEADKVVCE